MSNAPRKNSYHEDVMFDQPKFERILRNNAEKNKKNSNNVAPIT